MKCLENGFDPPQGEPEDSILRVVVRRVTGMALTWLSFGVIVGYLTAPHPTLIGIAAGVIAGTIVLTPLGAMLGAIGCKWKESLNGGVLGLAGGTAFAFVQGRPDAATVAAFCVIFGGLVGATVATFLRLPRLVLGGVRRLARLNGRVDKPVAV